MEFTTKFLVSEAVSNLGLCTHINSIRIIKTNAVTNKKKLILGRHL